MNANKFREIILYRYRYVLGYGIFAVFLLLIVSVEIHSVPYGLSNSEMASAVTSNSLNPGHPTLTDIINLPYHILQKISIGLLGLSVISIKLPSILLALASGVMMAFMLRLWFSHNVALFALILSVVSVPFISMARSGTPTILFVFLLLSILYSAIKVISSSKRQLIWKIVLFLSTILLLYIPFGIYTFMALLIAGLLHPHVRHQLRKTPWHQYLLFTVAGVILLMPHFLVLFSDGGVAVLRQLFGVSAIKDHLSSSAIGGTFIALIKTLFFFNKPNVSEHITPFFNITFMLFVAFGLAKVIINRYSARSYLLLIWLVFCIPMLLMDSSQLPLLFIPSVLLLAIGIETFTREWYKLFPNNPYARIGALIPIGLLIVGMLTIAIGRYFFAYAYSDTRAIFHPHLQLVTDLIDEKPTQLIVAPEHSAFYDILRSKHENLIVTTAESMKINGIKTIVLSNSNVQLGGTPTTIITSHLQKDSVLLRVYSAKQ